MRLRRKDIHPGIRRLAKHFGVTFRIGLTPKDVKIYGVKIPKKVVAAYCGEGVVFVQADPQCHEMDWQVALLHEIGHAILDFYPIKVSKKMNECKANAIALGFSAFLGLPVRHELVHSMSRFTKMKGTALPEPEGT